MQKIIPCLWFDKNAEEAVNFYVSILKNSKITDINYCGEEASKVAKMPVGTVLTVSFELEGQKFLALNGGPQFTFSPAVSFLVNCETQEEIDRLWEKLSDGGKPWDCGWLQDKYGLSWQIAPRILDEMISDPDPVKVERVMKVMMTMKKLDLEELKKAYEGE